MPWFKVDDKLHDHRKARTTNLRAMGLWVLAGSWCADHLYDGFVPRSVALRWGTVRDAQALVQVGLWNPTEHEGEPGWNFNDWEKYQPMRAEIEEQRREGAERVKRWREEQRKLRLVKGPDE